MTDPQPPAASGDDDVVDAIPDTPALHERIDRLTAELKHRPPHRDAEAKVRVTNPHARSAYMTYVRLAGRREPVLDYAAWLLSADHDKELPTLELVAIEREDGDELQLLFAKTLYTGE